MSPARPDDVPERWLKGLLRFGGSVMLLAYGAVFLPARWMAASHAWLGLGDFPASPLVEYLARSIAVLYAVHGGLLWVVSFDVRRYAPVIRYVGLTNVVFGVLLVGIDLHAGLPLYWTLGEGPPVAAIGVLFWVLAGRLSPP